MEGEEADPGRTEGFSATDVNPEGLGLRHNTHIAGRQTALGKPGVKQDRRGWKP